MRVKLKKTTKSIICYSLFVRCEVNALHVGAEKLRSKILKEKQR